MEVLEPRSYNDDGAVVGLVVALLVTLGIVVAGFAIYRYSRPVSEIEPSHVNIRCYELKDGSLSCAEL